MTVPVELRPLPLASLVKQEAPSFRAGVVHSMSWSVMLSLNISFSS
ncbi:hypothetical protein RQ359_001095 [Sulfuracidifex metallicus DSM 6482 = JCM 9184]|nr:hypothetical protein [Sulfuracidifex metallicus]WOE52023.1 hypothetical protein RQ359_001095 [Sulfuracidifex metallicus DSM 6482 = JCM 9184]